MAKTIKGDEDRAGLQEKKDSNNSAVNIIARRSYEPLESCSCTTNEQVSLRTQSDVFISLTMIYFVHRLLFASL